MTVLAPLTPFENKCRIIEKHLHQKLGNRDWLEKCLNKNPDAFPYRISSDGKGKIHHPLQIYHPDAEHTNTTAVKYLKRPACRFVVNVPLAYEANRSFQSTYQKLSRLLKNESFSTSASNSSRLVEKRLAVVCGVNRYALIDPAINRAFKQSIARAPKLPELALRCFGFFWHAQWRRKNPSKHLYCPQKSFRLLKALSSDAALAVRNLCEPLDGKVHPAIQSQVPYQAIRQVILRSDATKKFVEDFEDQAKNSPVYLTMMDADALSLRSTPEKLGVFSHISHNTSLLRPPSVIGVGYSAAHDELPLIQLAVELDMAVRKAMTSTIPYGAYFPEPFLAILVRKAGEENFLGRLSFKGRSLSLESRRIIANGRKAGVLDENMLFLQKGIVTTSPKRWKTDTMRHFSTLDSKQVKQMRCLKALRGLSQTHIFPKQWADNIYAALDFCCHPVTNATVPMRRIFSLFDPISRMQAHQGRYTTKVFDSVMRQYNNSLEGVQKEILIIQKLELQKRCMPEKMIDLVERAAQASGRAIYQTLLPYL